MFVDELDEVPEGATVIFSAHGVSPAVRGEAQQPTARRDRRHLPAGREGARRGAPLRRRRASTSCSSAIEGHEEVEGTYGEAPERIHVVAERRRGRRTCGSAIPSGRLPDPDDAGGRRDGGGRGRAAGALPGRSSGPPSERHLLRDPEPPGRGPRARAATAT